jgi:hypothetical protein
MALKLLQPGNLPLGQFDGLDSELTGFLGGEVCTFGSVAVPSSDLAAADAFDGYISPSGPKRVVVTKTLTSTSRPLMLADDGVAGYGTLFGTVVGGSVGQNTSGTVIGPHTALGSGKITCWAQAGLYAVTLDAVDTDSVTGITVSNPTLTAGSALYYTTAGLLTTATTNSTKVGTFVEFTSNGSLVTTPNNLVGSLSAPDGALSSSNRSYTQAVFYFNPPTA